MKTRSIKKRHFSLIELLVVITIIGILSAIILPAIGSSKEAADRTKAASQIKDIRMAVELYYSDYQTLPSTSNPWGALKASGNPRQKDYYTGSQTTSTGDQISIAIDDNYDNQMSVSGHGTVSGSVAVWTTVHGKDIKSWERN